VVHAQSWQQRQKRRVQQQHDVHAQREEKQ
jgi:hypothetical protein